MEFLEIDLDMQHAITLVRFYAISLPEAGHWQHRHQAIAPIIDSIVDIDYRELPKAFPIPANSPAFVADLRDLADTITKQADWRTVISNQCKIAILNVIEGVGDKPGNRNLTDVERQAIIERVDSQIKNSVFQVCQLVVELDDIIENSIVSEPTL